MPTGDTILDTLGQDAVDRARKWLEEALENDEDVARVIDKLTNGTATYIDVNTYAQRVGELSGQTVWRSYRYATRARGELELEILKPVLYDRAQGDYDLVVDFAKKVQEEMNQNFDISMKAVAPEYNNSRVNNLIQKLYEYENENINFRDFLESSVENMALSAADETQEANVAAQYDAGLRPMIHRRATPGCCEWCAALAGDYDYSPKMNKDVYHRHRNCRCVVYYDPGTGRRFQDVWTKKFGSAPSDFYD